MDRSHTYTQTAVDENEKDDKEEKDEQDEEPESWVVDDTDEDGDGIDVNGVGNMVASCDTSHGKCLT